MSKEVGTLRHPSAPVPARAECQMRDSRHRTAPPCVARVQGAASRVQDWSELEEKEFRQCLKGISTYAELEGVANRRKWLNAPQLTRWSAAQREMILERKWELQHDRR